MATAEIVAIGSELLLGQIVDTNSAWMAERLTALGVDMYYKTVVGDNPGRMKEVIGRALDRSDIVVTSGGLGPTQDDLTREIVAEVTGLELVLDPDLLEQIENRFRSRGFVMTRNNERQAYIPEGAIPVENPNGTAPSFIVEDSRGIVFSLPGVPVEMKWLFDNRVAPYLRETFDLSELITHRILKVAGMGESAVDDLVGHLIANSRNPTVGVLAHPGQVDVRITAKAPSLEAAAEMIEPVEAEVRSLLGRHIFASDDDSMEDAVAALLGEGRKTEHRSPRGPRVIAIEVDKGEVGDDAVSDAIGEVVATTLGDSLRTTIESVRTKRDNVVMVRVSRESLARLDELVDCGLTNSRSEAAAFLIAEGIKTRTDLYEKIAEQSKVIRQAKERLKALLDDEAVPEPDDE